MNTLVVFSGAGLSAESGIQTFRDAGGLWEQHRIEDVASPEGWERNKKLVLDFYALRFQKNRECQPNAAHRAIARLREAFEVVCITQNVDTLLERVGVKNVWHLHGRIDYQKCERHHTIPAYADPYFSCDFRSEILEPIKVGDACPLCGGQLRPDVVWFGEAVDMRPDFIDELVSRTSVFIGVGTSVQVYPAAGIVPLFAQAPEKYFIDPNPAYEMLHGFHVIKEGAGVGMSRVAKHLLGL